MLSLFLLILLLTTSTASSPPTPTPPPPPAAAAPSTKLISPKPIPYCYSDSTRVYFELSTTTNNDTNNNNNNPTKACIYISPFSSPFWCGNVSPKTETMYLIPSVLNVLGQGNHRIIVREANGGVYESWFCVRKQGVEMVKLDWTVTPATVRGSLVAYEFILTLDLIGLVDDIIVCVILDYTIDCGDNNTGYNITTDVPTTVSTTEKFSISQLKFNYTPQSFSRSEDDQSILLIRPVIYCRNTTKIVGWGKEWRIHID